MDHSRKYIKAMSSHLSKNALSDRSAGSAQLAAYIGTKLKVLGVSTQTQRDLFKSNYFLTGDTGADMKLFDELFRLSGVFEVKNASLLFLEANQKRIFDSEWFEFCTHWVNHVDNWAHSDTLSKFYTRYLEHPVFGPELFKLIRDWNSDTNPWKRRQSLVAIFYYARTKKRYLPFNQVRPLITARLKDPEYFVQKGLGWTLRECYSVYPEDTFNFMNEHSTAISSTAFSAACEKMTEQRKNTLKLKRKNNRLKKHRKNA
jgi:3-methyladenine DNA glycosylase AlkD